MTTTTMMQMSKKKMYALAGVTLAALFALSNINGGFQSDDNESGSGRRRLLNGYDDSVTTLPSYAAKFANVWEPMQTTDQPIFWYIGLGGGVTFTNVAARCLNLTQISPKGDANATSSITAAPPVRVVIHKDDGAPYLNLNPSTHAGLDQMASLQVVQNRQADLIVTPHITYAGSSATLLDAQHKGRVFAMFRHPVKRVVEQFYYRQAATWDPFFDQTLASMSIDAFAHSNYPIDNVMVRLLTNIYGTSDVTVQQLQLAKDVLRQKVIVGIDEWMEASIVRFEQYFGWWDSHNVASDPTINQCHVNQIALQPTYPQVLAGGETWQTLTIRNWADLELYSYAKRLFAEQNLIVSATVAASA